MWHCGINATFWVSIIARAALYMSRSARQPALGASYTLQGCRRADKAPNCSRHSHWKQHKYAALYSRDGGGGGGGADWLRTGNSRHMKHKFEHETYAYRTNNTVACYTVQCVADAVPQCSNFQRFPSNWYGTSIGWQRRLSWNDTSDIHVPAALSVDWRLLNPRR